MTLIVTRYSGCFGEVFQRRSRFIPSANLPLIFSEGQGRVTKFRGDDEDNGASGKKDGCDRVFETPTRERVIEAF
jgi:hypothetical protein